MRILADPDRLHTNPYPELLYGEMRRQGAHVERYTIRKALMGKADILHFHWPQTAPPSGRGAGAHIDFWTRSSVERLAALPSARARGAKVFWTVHNLSRHDHAPSFMESMYWKRFIKNCDATIHMTQSGRALAFEQIPELKERPSYIIPHGLYPDVYEIDIDKKQAREKLGLPVDKKLLVYFGMIRPYKNVSLLIDNFLELDDDDAHLTIAGKVHKSAQGLQAHIEKSAQKSDNITLMLEFLSDETLSLLARAADLCVFPYREIFNSGSVFYALSAGRPSLVPQSPVFRELADDFGDQWVRCFDGALTADMLNEALNTLPIADLSRADACPQKTAHDQTMALAPDLSKIQWSLIAEKTLAAYQALR